MMYIERIDVCSPPPQEEYILFCHSSYEDRCLSILDRDLGAGKCSRVVVISSSELKELGVYKKNTDALKRYALRASGVEAFEVVSERSFLVKMLRSIDSELEKYDRTKFAVVVDISTFPKDRLLVLLRYLVKSDPSFSRIYFFYSAAGRYGTQACSGWLTKGVVSISPIIGFNGRQRTQSPSLLVLMKGLEIERSLILCRNLEPDRVILVSSKDNKDQREPGFRNTVQLSMEISGALCEEYVVDPLDNPVEVSNIVDKICAEYGEKYNISIGVNGSKISCLGLLMACSRNERIQLVYAYPREYNTDGYSESTGESWFGRVWVDNC